MDRWSRETLETVVSVLLCSSSAAATQKWAQRFRRLMIIKTIISQLKMAHDVNCLTRPWDSYPATLYFDLMIQICVSDTHEGAITYDFLLLTHVLTSWRLPRLRDPSTGPEPRAQTDAPHDHWSPTVLNLLVDGLWREGKVESPLVSLVSLFLSSYSLTNPCPTSKGSSQLHLNLFSIFQNCFRGKKLWFCESWYFCCNVKWKGLKNVVFFNLKRLRY